MPSINELLLQPAEVRVKRLEELEQRFGCTDKLFIRSLNDRQKSEWELSRLDKNGNTSLRNIAKSRRLLIVMCLCNESGVPILTRAEMANLEQADGRFTSALFDECLEHVGIVEDSDIAESVKNSETTPDESAQCATPGVVA